MSGFFIAGTDTGVGKTEVACLLLRASSRAGRRAVGMKPVAAGIAADDKENEDVARLYAAGNVAAPKEERCPYEFAPAIAPHIAARQAGVQISLPRLRDAFERLSAGADCVVVEAAGGVLVPLDERHDMLDLARELNLAVVLVVGMKLGCINHARLSAAAIAARGLMLAGWVANEIEPAMPEIDANIEYLDRHLPAPRLLRLPFIDATARGRDAVLDSLGTHLLDILNMSIQWNRETMK